MADMEERIELNYLLDFYGPLLTEHRREVMRLYCEEDLSLAEIADQLEITRQGVSDAVTKARRQLCDYEAKLGLVARYLALSEEAQTCLEALNGIRPAEPDRERWQRARQALENIIQIER
ncbi:MAG: YlxM family DNA-binding protein [Christensenellales bacterium]|nr:YlxM family DNA-binding protein [Christensenellales bacterium]